MMRGEASRGIGGCCGSAIGHRWRVLLLGAWILSGAGPGNRQAFGAEADYTDAVAELQEVVRAELERKIIRGVSVALIDDQRVVHVEGFGLADEKKGIQAAGDTVYRAGSISKLFNALAVMQLVERGRLDLDAPVTGYARDFSIVVPFADADAITLRQLLCHRSGMIRESPVGGYFDPSDPGVSATVRSVAQCVLVNPPGAEMRYSNVAPTIAGHAVSLVTKTPYATYQRQHLLDPLGMKHSSFVLDDRVRRRLAVGYMRVAKPGGGFRRIEAPQFDLGTLPAGNLFVSAEDLARLAMMIFADGRIGDRPLVKPETLEQMFTVQLTDEEEGFGLGFYVGRFGEHKVVRHSGAVYGFSTAFTALLEHKLGVIVLANEDIASGAVRRIGKAAMSLMLDAKIGEKSVPRPEPIALDGDALDAMTGDYESPSYWARIERVGDRLHADVSGQPLTLTPIGPLTFVAEGRIVDRAEVPFRRDGAGRIFGFTALGQSFTRVDPAKVERVPDAWRKYLGSYGPSFIPVIVSIKHGHLYAMTENLAAYRLAPANRVVFNMPRGLYTDEELVFQTGPDGNVHSVILANMTLERIR